MKQLFLFIISLSFLQVANAQLVKFGPELALEATTFTQKVNGDTYDNKFIGGARLGVAFDMPIYQSTPALYFQPSISLRFFSGGKTSNVAYDRFGNGFPIAEQDERTYNLYRIHIPMFVTFKTHADYEVNHFTFSIGPYVAFNFAGNYSRTYSSALNGSERPVFEDRKIYVGNTLSKYDIRPFDFGVTAGIGYEMRNGLNLRAFYEFGLLDLTPGGLSNYDLRHQGGGISLSYYIDTYRYY